MVLTYLNMMIMIFGHTLESRDVSIRDLAFSMINSRCRVDSPCGDIPKITRCSVPFPVFRPRTKQVRK